MTPRQDPDIYINEPTRLRNLLAERQKLITDRHVTHIVFQSLAEEGVPGRQAELQDLDFDLPNIQSMLRHPYLERLLRIKTGRIAGRGVPMQQHQHHLIPVVLSVSAVGKLSITGACDGPWEKKQPRCPKEEIPRGQHWAEMMHGA